MNSQEKSAERQRIDYADNSAIPGPAIIRAVSTRSDSVGIPFAVAL